MSSKRQLAARKTTTESPEAASTTVALAVSSQSSVSPLPAPEVLRGYAEVQPDFPERFMRLVEDEAAHRRQSEGRALDAQITRAARGQLLGFAIALAGFVATVVLGWQGHGTAAGVVGAFDVVALVSIFVQGTKKDRQ